MFLPLFLPLQGRIKLHPPVAQSIPAQCTQQNWLQLERPDQQETELILAALVILDQNSCKQNVIKNFLSLQTTWK